MANSTRQFAATGAFPILAPPHEVLFLMYQPAFWRNGTLRGVVIRGFAVEPFVELAFAGCDNTTIQFFWRDLTPDNTDDALIYAWNADAADVSSLSFVQTITFGQRQWQFGFHYVNGDAHRALQAERGGILGALLLVELIIIVVTVFFIRNRCVRVCLLRL
jgi:hypothetical protein